MWTRTTSTRFGVAIAPTTYYLHLLLPPYSSPLTCQPAELNYWLPLTACWGANTLWCETRRGAADYIPFEMAGPGTYQRFWGNQLRHFTQPNDTGSTRVSFDLRCVPLSLFVNDWKAIGM